MALDFPASPSSGQTFSSNGVTWSFDGDKWKISTGTGIEPVFISSSTPTGVDGQLYWDSDESTAYIYYNDGNTAQWVPLVSTAPVTFDATAIVSGTLPVARGGTGTTSFDAGKIVEGNTEAEVVDTGSDGHFKVTTEGTERLRIDSSGDATFTGDLTISAPEGISAALLLQADEGDDNGDTWRIISNQDDNDLTFSNNVSGSFADKVTFRNDGKVGIGTSSPKRQLHINGGSETVKIQLTNTSTGSSTDGDGFQIAIATNGDAYLEQRENSPLIFSTNNIERMRIDSSGRLLINHTADTAPDSYASKLQLCDTGDGGSSISIRRDENTNSPPVLLFTKSRSGSKGGNTLVNNGDTIGKLVFYAADGTDVNTKCAQILAEVDGSPGSNDMPGRLVFSTTADGANSPTERLRISSSGNVGIGTTSPGFKLHCVEDGSFAGICASSNVTADALASRFALGNSVGTARFTVNMKGGNNEIAYLGSEGSFPFYFQTNGAERVRIASDGKVGIGTGSPAEALHVVGDIVATGDITAFYSSDRRLKENIKNIPDAVEKVQQINGVSYSWKDKEIDGYFKREKEIGVIAQDVEEVLPEIVATRDDGYKAVRYDRLVALLIEAVKEQQEQIDELKAKLEG